jgi:hypothetical protein
VSRAPAFLLLSPTISILYLFISLSGLTTKEEKEEKEISFGSAVSFSSSSFSSSSSSSSSSSVHRVAVSSNGGPTGDEKEKDEAAPPPRQMGPFEFMFKAAATAANLALGLGVVSKVNVHAKTTLSKKEIIPP